MRAMHYRGWVRLNSLNWSLSNRQIYPVRITAESESSFHENRILLGSICKFKYKYTFIQIHVFIQICCTFEILLFEYFVSVAWKSLQRDIFLATDKSGRDWYWLVVTLFLLAYYQLLSVKQAYTGITILPLCKGSFHISKQSFLTIFETMILFSFSQLNSRLCDLMIRRLIMSVMGKVLDKVWLKGNSRGSLPQSTSTPKKMVVR